ncbi:MAG: hypothetical protein ACLTMF_07060 [Alistipes putredinis]
MNGNESVEDDSPALGMCGSSSKPLRRSERLVALRNGNAGSDSRQQGLTFIFTDGQNDRIPAGHADVRLIEANHFAASRNGIDPFWANVPLPDGKGSYVYQRLPMTTRACNDTSQRIFRLCRSICVQNDR